MHTCGWSEGRQSRVEGQGGDLRRKTEDIYISYQCDFYLNHLRKVVLVNKLD